jgi:hypothetical protein
MKWLPVLHGGRAGFAVRKRIGALMPSFRSSAETPKPSSLGIMTSSSSRSGFSFTAFSKQIAPFSALMTRLSLGGKVHPRAPFPSAALLR